MRHAAPTSRRQHDGGFTLVELPAVSRRKRAAFTLVELLVVVGVVALLVAILAPALEVARSTARSAVCRNHLSQIGKAFRAAESRHNTEQGESMPYPDPRDWPKTPMNVVETKELYICPEATIMNASITEYQVRSQEGFLIEFFEGQRGVDHCIVVRSGNGYKDYGFEDLAMTHSDMDYNDVVFRVFEGPPVKARVYSAESGYANSLCYNQQVVPGYEDLRTCVGQELDLGGGQTNYGINAKAHRHRVASTTVVLLDYDRLVANDTEDVRQHLLDSARHRGRLNVLYADQSVRGRRPGELDPAMPGCADQWVP